MSTEVIATNRDDFYAKHGVCTCGTELSACVGCGDGRCLVCDPYRSDDCRWTL